MMIVGLLALVSGCQSSPTTTPMPTSSPTLNAILWVDFPVIFGTAKQAANVIVTDRHGLPVPNAVVVGRYNTGNGWQTIVFPGTDDNGLARANFELPVFSAPQVVTVTVTAALNSEWDHSSTAFEVYP